MPNKIPVVLFRDAKTGEYLVARQRSGYEQLEQGDEVELHDGRTVEVKRTVRCSQAELQVFCE